MNIHRPAVIGFGILLSLLTFQIVRAANSAFQGSTSFGSITDGESVQLIDSSFVSAPLPLSTVEGRLTLTSGTPITTADVTAATTIYFTPYKGDRIYLYDGTRWKLYSFSELSLALGTLTSARPYDVFIYDNAGTLTLESLAWTSGTARATALVTQNGVLSKTGQLTRRYLGTFYTTATTTTEDSDAKRFVWNYYNRVQRPLQVLEATDSWSYTTSAWRQMNASAANQVEIVTGVAENPIWLTLQSIVVTSSTSWQLPYTSIGEDSTTDPAGRGTFVSVYSGVYNTMLSVLAKIPTIGYHYYAALEYGDTGVVFYGDGGSTNSTAGLRGWVEG